MNMYEMLQRRNTMKTSIRMEQHRLAETEQRIVDQLIDDKRLDMLKVDWVRLERESNRT